MIIEYHRPKTLEEALSLIGKPNTYPMGGGTSLNQHQQNDFAVVDLQDLGLNKLRKSGDKLEIGATATLQALYESEHIPQALKQAIKLEAPLNLRNMSTIAGSLVTCDGRSPFAATLLALDPKVYLRPDNKRLFLGDLLPTREETLRGKLITKIDIPLTANLMFQYVARTPGDTPIISAALAQWSSGRTRLVIGGWGNSPSVAMDGKLSIPEEFTDLEIAAQNAAHGATDEWASAEYRSEVAAILVKRCING